MKASLTIYKLVILIAVLVSVGVFVAGLHLASMKRQDEQTQNATFNIQDKLSSYTDGKRQLPASLGAAGIHKVPKTITYKKINLNTYRLCALYKTTYTGFYHRGENCQVSQVSIQSFIKNNDGSYTVCGMNAGNFATDGTRIASTVKRPDGAPIVDINNELFVFSAQSKAFDSNCNELSESDLHVGDRVDVFDIVDHVQYPATPKPMVSIFLKRTDLQ